MSKKQIMKRLKNPLFLAAMAAAVYQVLQKYEVAPDMGTWQLWVDLISYAVLGFGIYSTFETAEDKKKKPGSG
jgi:hypothetical protein